MSIPGDDNGGPSNQGGSVRFKPTPNIKRTNTGRSRLEVTPDPWMPIVLSLDGGGIRGLSELIILRRIMQHIQQLIDNDGGVNPISSAFSVPSSAGKERSNGPFAGSNSAEPNSAEQPVLLPCYFFDYMVGTSTGGLIAVMLGRLRMSVDDSIKAYWRLGNYIFRPRRYIRSYSSKRLRGAIIRVVEKHCGCHAENRRCHGDQELLRQYDYAEEDDVSNRENPARQNFTCKVVLVAQKKSTRGQTTHLFRSYNHNERFENDHREYNPQTLGRVTTKIWEACRATSAAPYYFRNMIIGPDEFLDGGAGNNNPSNIAWNEAKWMSNRDDPHNGGVAVLLSLGTGERAAPDLFGNQKSLFYIFKVLRRGRNEITNTQNAHNETLGLADSAGSLYFRLSVPPVEGDQGHNGLAGVKLSECKRQAKSGWRKLVREKRKKVGQSVARAVGRSSSWQSSSSTHTQQQQQQHAETTTSNQREPWYAALMADEARPNGQKRKKGAFKPDKYDYTTYDTIFDRTEEYCTSQTEGEDVRRKIEDCATILLGHARARYKDDPERWRRFVSHPNPLHPSFIQTERRQSEAEMS